jgi:hypothetical protein
LSVVSDPERNVVTVGSFNYSWVNAQQVFPTYPLGNGVRAAMTVHDPHLASTFGYHSLGEIMGMTQDGKQIVEVGWMKELGDPGPKLFVFHWENGSATCYNGCGYQQYSSTVVPGMQVPTGDVFFEIIRSNTNIGWVYWIYAYGEWVGYFPESLWSGQFSNMQAGEWFGEVSMPLNVFSPCAEMGNGIFGSQAGAAGLWWMQYSYADDPEVAWNSWFDANASYYVSDPSFYNAGNQGPTSFNWGGPGAGCQ